MEQLAGVFGLDVRMIVIQIINFSILLGVLWYFLYRPLITMLDRRKEDIISATSKADAADTLLQNAERERLETLAHASQEAKKVIDSARSTAERKAAEIITAAEQKAARLVADAELAAAEEKRSMLAKSKEEIARMIVVATEKAVSARTHK
jgi:F-type H+-transporting ATPase subunit b